MAAHRMQNWDAGDFSRSFREAASHADEMKFQEKFSALADALEPLDHEFLHETAQCGMNMGTVLQEVRDIASRMSYCDRNRGMEHTCQSIYADVDRAIGHVEDLRQRCFA